ncbi:ABC transporter substrate-binding protein [Mycolicibacter senuensis]|uniref:ABC transporter substrate-binding protein n=1 Tax=Mycolicibacter senuensis TaxID=386913 RepID=A0A7I9XEL6_9MYCO|nr:ABC transporter substrate-binding protein [Mycolicibacter senuensis]MDQ2629057.1 ABC transporter substrate-binding protein [Actinomycetota bacterium]ORW64816.1 ABC transporter substrate-binding protein [Mycolicibacter senuensis]GFG68409.1 ABC transporter substrate-binding protein [Mycolicibacter senuensis]
MPRARRVVPALTAALAIALALAGCSAEHAFRTADGRQDCITDFDPHADYFPDKSTLSDAANFALEYHRSYQILTVHRPYLGGKPVSYVLVRCGAPTPALTGELAAAQRITVPVRSLYSGSTTHLAMITELDKADVVTGVASPAAVADPQIRERIDTGETVGYAPGGQINIESVLHAGPDALVTQGMDDAGYPKLREAGLPVVADAEWLEPTPLGRAEWIKVFAALTGTERRAGQIYQGIRDRYRALAAQASAAAPTKVLVGTMYSGNWSMPTGASYSGRLVADAGGTYPWLADDGAESRQLNFESVYTRAADAPLWLVTDDWATVDDAVARDSRYGELVAVRTGQVWSATRAIGPGGGNLYWERGTARPDLLLGDLVAILHPELAAQGHGFEFYRQVPR